MLVPDDELMEVAGGTYEGLRCIRYTVEQGDTLMRIVRKFSSSLRVICELNGIKDIHRIQPGQELIVPVGLV